MTAAQRTLSTSELVSNIFWQGTARYLTGFDIPKHPLFVDEVDRGLLFQCVLVNHLWASEGIKVLWAFCDHDTPQGLGMLLKFPPDRRQLYASCIRKLAINSISTPFEDLNSSGLQFPALTELTIFLRNGFDGMPLDPVAPVFNGSTLRSLSVRVTPGIAFADQENLHFIYQIIVCSRVQVSFKFYSLYQCYPSISPVTRT
jgi:hypothetical protein